jgi:cold shock CspA family protein
MAEMPMSDFYHIPFVDIGEGADLVAALSRQLASPRVDLGDIGPLEVGMIAGDAGADVYVSAGALTAIERAFARPPVVTPLETIPDNVVWILREGQKHFLGRGDVLGRIIPAPNEPLGTERRSIGIVKFWRDDKGYGVIETPETAPWGIWCSFGAIARTGGIATLPTGEQFPVTYDENGRAFSPTGEPVLSGYTTGGGFRSLAVGDRVEVKYYRADQTSYRYVARWVRRVSQGGK